jgi:S-adenosylmethionine:tRNA ribosyltransferase-isomerase
LKLSDLDFELPEELIAQEPLADRAASRMLVCTPDGGIQERGFRALPSLLEPGDLLVVNSSRVSARRLFGRRASGGRVELLTLSRLPDGAFEALARPARKLAPGERIAMDDGLEAKIIEDLGEGRKRVRFQPEAGLDAALETAGEVPLPPYIHARLAREERYQTIYARVPGSAAAPTAGLHFTPEIMAELAARGIQTAEVHLSISLDTFRPVAAEDLSSHEMHGEDCFVPEETAKAAAECRGRIIAVGTTSARTLESAALGPRVLEPGHRRTRLLIQPGYEWKAVDGLLTNFHMPRTTMLAMAAALIGPETLKAAYAEAIRSRFRFLSFGDCMLAWSGSAKPHERSSIS